MSPFVGAIASKLLQAEVLELVEAVNEQDVAAVLDEVTDVIFRARQLASDFGLDCRVLDQYAEYKGRLRRSGGKDKTLELTICKGLLTERGSETSLAESSPVRTATFNNLGV